MKTIFRLLLASGACLLFTQQASAISIRVNEDSTTRLDFTLDWSSASPSSASYTTYSQVIARVSGSSPTGHTGIFVEVVYYTGGLCSLETFWIDSVGTTSLTAPYSLLGFSGASTTFSKGSSTSARFVYGQPAAPAQTAVTGSVVGWGDNSSGQATPPAGLLGVTAVAGGRLHSLALKSDGTVVGWGDNTFGQAAPPIGLNNVIAISAGHWFSVALKSDGTVVCWGRNDYGQISPPPGLSDVVAISAGDYHCLAMKSDHTVVGWGSDSYGEAVFNPDNYPSLAQLTGIAAGNYFSLAVGYFDWVREVVGWGKDDHGQASPPTGNDGLFNVVALAAGGYHGLAMHDGVVVGWGNGRAAIPPWKLSNVSAIAAGQQHSVALKNDGTVVCWGDNSYGQTNPPAGLTGVVAIGSGSAASHTLVVVRDTASMLFDLTVLVAELGLSPADGNALGSLLEDAEEAMAAAAAAAEPADVAHLLGAARDSLRDFNDRVKELVKAGTLTRDQGETLTAAAKQVAASTRRRLSFPSLFTDPNAQAFNGDYRLGNNLLIRKVSSR